MEKQFLQQQQTATPSRGMFIQPKLTINQPNDAYEQEADAMADKVMRMEQPGVQLKPLPISSLQRKCAHCEEEEQKMQRKEMNGEEKTADSNLENYVGSLNGGGQPLPNAVRNFYEPKFGYDFSNVKVHTGNVAAKSAQSINALAYTSGNNIVFNDGQYAPNTESGKRLMGHELTHVVQQGNGIKPKLLQRDALTDDDIDISLLESIAINEPAELPEENTNEVPIQLKPDIMRKCPWQKQSKVIRNDCSSSSPLDKSNYIKELHVDLSSQEVRVTWSKGKVEKWLCSPHASNTPKGKDVVGDKCSVNHTNRHKDGMAWFTSFSRYGLKIGFHNSQKVAKGTSSHGCVRVSCAHAEIINKNSWSGKTQINVVK